MVSFSTDNVFSTLEGGIQAQWPRFKGDSGPLNAILFIATKNCPQSRIDVRPTVLLRYHAHMHDLHYKSQANYGHTPPTHTKLVQRSVGSKDRVEQQMDGHTLRTPNNKRHNIYLSYFIGYAFFAFAIASADII